MSWESQKCLLGLATGSKNVQMFSIKSSLIFSGSGSYSDATGKRARYYFLNFTRIVYGPKLSTSSSQKLSIIKFNCIH